MKILWLKNNLLHPLDAGGKIRTYNILKRLNRSHSIHYVAFADENTESEYIDLLKEYAEDVFVVSSPKRAPKKSLRYFLEIGINLFTDTPFTVDYYRSNDIKDMISRLLGKNHYDILVLDFLTMSANIPEGINVPLVYFSHNVEALIWERLAKYEKNPVKKFVFTRERDRISKLERFTIERSALTVTISKVDCDYYRKIYKGNNVEFIPTGVDIDYFHPYPSDVEPGRIVFVGSMDWLPNIDAVTYFAKKIYPSIKRQIPDATLYIVGRNPDSTVVRLGEVDNSIIVTGTVDDIREYVAEACCAVVPIRIGGGTRLKIYELMAMQKVVVSTTVGAEGLDYTNGENIIIADEPEEFASQVVRTIKNNQFRNEVGKNARNFVVDECSWEKVSNRFDRLIRSLQVKE